MKVDAACSFDDFPEDLAAEHLGRYSRGTVEWLSFVSRFSAAVFAYQATKRLVDERIEEALQDLRARHGWPEGWEGEIEDSINERRFFLQDSRKIAAAGAILTGVSAVELLLSDTAPASSPSVRGLARRIEHLLTVFRHTAPDAERPRTVERQVRDLRNSLAHSLDGSYWFS